MSHRTHLDLKQPCGCGVPLCRFARLQPLLRDESGVSDEQDALGETLCLSIELRVVAVSWELWSARHSVMPHFSRGAAISGAQWVSGGHAANLPNSQVSEISNVVCDESRAQLLQITLRVVDQLVAHAHPHVPVTPAQPGVQDHRSQLSALWLGGVRAYGLKEGGGKGGLEARVRACGCWNGGESKAGWRH